MRVLITGGAGFIGSHLIEACLAAGHHVETIDRITYAGCRDNLPWRFQGWRCVDICDRVMVDETLRRVRPDWVIHAAAETHVGRAISEAEEFIRTNVIGTHVLLEACLGYWRERGSDPAFRFLHVSTDEVHGSIDTGEWTEGSQYAPNNQYAASKAAADHLCRAYWATQKLPVIVTHCGNNYGTRQHPEKLIPTLIGQALAGEKLTLHGDGLNVRDWIAVEDHCAGLLAALANGKPGATYAFSAGETFSNWYVANLVAMWVPKFGGIVLTDDRPGNDRRYAMDCTQTQTDLNWAPRRHLGASMPGMVDWYATNKDRPYGEGSLRAWG